MKPKKLLSFLLATVMTISLLPTFTLTALADETPTTTTEKNITLGTTALKGGQASNVYFGSYQQSSAGSEQPAGQESIDWIKNSNGQINSQGAYYKKEPIKWRVLSNADGKAFLLSDKNLDVVRYHEDYESVTWETSTIRSWLNGTDTENFYGSAFSTAEKGVIAETTVVNENNPSYSTEGGNDTTDKVFLLSIAEAQNTSYFADNDSRKAVNTAYVYGGGKTGTNNMNGIGVADYWWLRSPGDLTEYAANVTDFGGVISDGDDVSYDLDAVRPAFNLNLSSVLFTSAAKGGKSSTAAKGGGAEILKNADLSTLTDNDGYKLTMLDESRKDFSASLKSLLGNTATVSYSGAKTGTTEYISVIIKNGNDVKYYSRACEVSSASGEVDIILPSDFDEANGDLLCVFNEQINGDYKTDYASNFVTVVTTETGLKNAVKSNGTVVLGKDITISETLEIGKNVILDLAGFTLTKTGANCGVIKVNQNTNFTLKDSSTAQTGKITGGIADDGSGVYVDSDSTFVMEGGTITDCGATSAYANVVHVYYSATFNMKGGIIRCSDGNYAVYVLNGATVKNDSQTSATVCYGLINNYGTKIGNFIWFSGEKLYACELIPDNGTVVMPENPKKAGYTFEGWYTKGGTNDDWGDKFTPETTITEYTNLFAKWTPILANEPTVTSSQNVNVTYGSYTNETISVTVTDKDEKTYSYSYQWKDSSKKEIAGATESTYTIPNDLTAGSYDYYCAVTAERKDNDETATTEKQITVTVSKAGSETTVTPSTTVVTYGETLTLTAEVEKSKAKAVGSDKVEFYLVEDESETLLGTADVVYADENKKDAGTATLELKVTDANYKNLEIGSNQITADYGGSVNLNDSKDDTITVTLNPKEVGLSWSGYDTRDYDGQQSNVTATATGIEDGDGEISVTVTDGKKTNASTHTATATELTGTYAEYYKLPDNVTQDYTISPKTVTATISTIPDQIYTGREIKPTITVKDGDTTIPESEYDVVYSNNKNAGQATVTLNDKANGNYTVSGSTTFIIKKADSSVTTAPTKAENLVYTGEELTLLTADGTAEGGTIKYSINGTDFTYGFADIPKVTDAKDDHKIWYKVVGDKNHNDTAPVCIEIKVAKKPINTAITLTAPVKYATPETSIDTDEYTATVVWSPTVEANGTFAKNTEYTATITVTPKANYTTVGIAENGYTLDGATSITNVADSNVVTAVFPKTAGSSGGSLTSRYTIKFDTGGGNTITNQTVTKNSKATEPSKPTKEGYIFDGWYTDSKFTTEYDFDTRVTKNITLYAKWVEDEIQEPSDDEKDNEQKPSENEWKNPFTDVTKADWFFDNVRYANENGLMSGTTDTTFAPNDNLTRGMLVTVLYRAEGEPAVNKSIPFADVNASQYYANAVIWAEQNGIVKGVTETEFAPDENITREQIATIIYRYAEYKGIVPTGAWAIKLDYADVAEISDYAVDGVMYCTIKNIMQGKDNNMFAPKDNATRAEIAAILNRFIESNK